MVNGLANNQEPKRLRNESVEMAEVLFPSPVGLLELKDVGGDIEQDLEELVDHSQLNHLLDNCFLVNAHDKNVYHCLGELGEGAESDLVGGGLAQVGLLNELLELILDTYLNHFTYSKFNVCFLVTNQGGHEQLAGVVGDQSVLLLD